MKLSNNTMKVCEEEKPSRSKNVAENKEMP
jgi:hypothetical protein